MIKRIIECIIHPKKILIALMVRGYLRFIPDEYFIKTLYKYNFGHYPDLQNPKTFNEKIQWLKLHDKNPKHTIMVDKYLVKDEVAKIIGEQYIVKTLGVWDSFEDISFEDLPDSFVLKCTHDSGGLVIVRDKKKLNIEKARKKINKALKFNFYYVCREWPYKNVKPRIIAEEFLNDETNYVPEDYKIYCMNGKPQYIVVFHNRFNDDMELCESVYNTKWEKQNFSFDKHFKISDFEQDKPACLDEMLLLAEKLCKNLCQVRVDFYIVNGKLYFGEMTYFTASGLMPMIPPEMDEELGTKFDLYLDY